MSAFVAATQSGDLNALTQLLASDVRILTDDGGEVRAALIVIVDGPEGPVQTAAFEIEDGVIRALYVVRNLDKSRYLATAPSSHETGRGAKPAGGQADH